MAILMDDFMKCARVLWRKGWLRECIGKMWRVTWGGNEFAEKMEGYSKRIADGERAE